MNVESVIAKTDLFDIVEKSRRNARPEADAVLARYMAGRIPLPFTSIPTTEADVEMF